MLISVKNNPNVKNTNGKESSDKIGFTIKFNIPITIPMQIYANIYVLKMVNVESIKILSDPIKS